MYNGLCDVRQKSRRHATSVYRLVFIKKRLNIRRCKQLNQLIDCEDRLKLEILRQALCASDWLVVTQSRMDRGKDNTTRCHICLFRL